MFARNYPIVVINHLRKKTYEHSSGVCKPVDADSVTDYPVLLTIRITLRGDGPIDAERETTRVICTDSPRSGSIRPDADLNTGRTSHLHRFVPQRIDRTLRSRPWNFPPQLICGSPSNANRNAEFGRCQY